jgi:hypothetical protein
VLTKHSTSTIRPLAISKSTSSGDLLAEEEAGDVHLVHHRVGDHHLAGEVRGDRGVAVRAVHDQRLTDLPGRDQRSQLRVLRVEPAHEPDLDQAPTRALGVGVLGPDDGERARGVHGERLLAQHGLAVLDAGQHLVLVELAGGGDDHGVDLRVGDRGQRVGDHAAARHAGGDRVGLLGEGVAHHHHAGAGDPAVQAGDVVGAHHPDAEDGDPQLVRGDVGEDRQHAGGGLGGGHACSSCVVVGVPISSERSPQEPM